MQFIPDILGFWLWWVLVGVLLILELMMPGVFFIWLAIAAAIVALLDAAFDMAWQYEMLAFAAFSLVSVYVGRAVLRRRDSTNSDSPHLNQRMRGYVGQSFPLSEAISGGRGKVVIEDTVWEVVGRDAAKGTMVRVTAVDGLRLAVEPV